VLCDEFFYALTDDNETSPQWTQRAAWMRQRGFVAAAVRQCPQPPLPAGLVDRVLLHAQSGDTLADWGFDDGKKQAK
jgi:hypothetical protein